MIRCEVVEMRNSADAVGYLCSRTASTQCSDCGSELCESHAETCGGCRSIFCPSCLSLHQSLHRKEPQRTTAKISLAKAHSCAGVVRVRFMDRKERGLTGVRMRPARRVHRVLLDRACVQGHNHCPNLSVCIRKTKFRRCSRSHFPSFESGA